jgi:cell division septation protein DedD
MQETLSWKGHSFTLFVFAGIVVLCSIFFVLGMLVGRTHGTRAADTPASPSHAKAAAQSGADTITTADDAPLTRNERSAPKRAEVTERAAPPVDPSPRATETRTPDPASASNGIHFQIGAVAREDAAHKLFNDVRKRGFPAVVLAPSPDDKNPLYRVQVGPYASDAEAEVAKRKLESLKYKPIIKK